MVERFKNEAGYSLVEVMVAIMLLTLAIIPMVGMFDAGLRAAVLGSNYDQARALANEKLEEIKALPYEVAQSEYRPTNAGGSPDTQTQGIFEYTITTTYMAVKPAGLEPEASSRTMMRVEVTVTWDDASKSYKTTGLISRG